MRTKLAILLLVLVVAIGCAHRPRVNKWTADKMNLLQLGMSKERVIKILGMPTSTSAIGDQAYLSYTLKERYRGTQQFFVRLVGDKVESYGRIGDFDSTKLPETKSTIDLNINKK